MTLVITAAMQTLGSDDQHAPLEDLHAEIDGCRKCEGKISGPLVKPSRLERGGLARVMVIGQAPGRTELETQVAFSGSAGRRLEQWLRACRPDVDNPRAGIYFTAAIKCLCPSPSDTARMARECWPHLRGQLTIIQPSLVISLGETAYQAVAIDDTPYSAALCRSFSTRELFLGDVPPLVFHFDLLVWPHPSGLNRQLNDPRTMTALAMTFPLVRQHLAEVLP